jgi:2-polyprenyl-3-methyl-5-hydroxy-6-metoxy-1,4-benzoquinol methylase
MSYDWKDGIEKTRYTPEWFDEADRRFVYASRLFAHDTHPFDKIIPFDRFKGKRVLEIGCGMGYHSELMLRAGARLTSIDISETSVKATQSRLAQRDLEGDVKQMDATNLDYPNEHFDFIWSWGVIHHSAWTGKIVKEMARVLRPGGEARVMVYNLNGMGAYITIIRNYLIGFWHGHTLDECLWKSTDGYMSRYYTKDILEDLFRIFFAQV